MRTAFRPADGEGGGPPGGGRGGPRGGRRALPRRCGRRGLRSYAEQDVHDVPVLDDVLLALRARLAVLLGLRPGAQLDHPVPGDDLGAYETALDVRVDTTGRLECGGAGGGGAGPRLLAQGGGGG